ncbi:MAG: hypothetical protein WCI27_05455 [Candidatus Omnitrophota bacterium]
MMKYYSSAVTLAELIVASIMVSFMTATIFSMDYGLRRSSNNSFAETSLTIKTKALAEKIRLAVRNVHGTPADTGIVFSNFNNDNATLCFRHDDLVGGAYTPSIYTDDRWTCFTKPGNPNTTYDVYSCEGADSNKVCTTSDTYEGSIVKQMLTDGNIPAPSVTANAATGVYYFEMTIVSRKINNFGLDHTGTTLRAGTTANPQVVVRFRENAGGY